MNAGDRTSIDDEAAPGVTQLPHRLHTPDRLGARGVEPRGEPGHAARGGHLTGVRMDALVAYEEQHAAPLEALDADVRVVRVGPIRRRLADRRILAGEPQIARCGLTGTRILDLEDLPEAVFGPDRVVVHGEGR